MINLFTCNIFNTIVIISYNWKFEGERQRDTPVTDAKGIITIINLLSGPLAAKFRDSCSDILVRFLGGDITLINQIKANNEFQQQLPETHPAKLFAQNNNKVVERKKIDYELKSPTMIGKSISDYKDKSCIYLIQFNNYIKFGKSEESIDRVKYHLSNLPNSSVWCMIESREIKKIEDSLKLNMKHKNKLIQLVINNCNQTEILENISPEEVEEHIYKIKQDVENNDYIKLQLAYIELEKQKLDNDKELKLKELDKELKLKELDNEIKLKELENKKLENDKEIKLKLLENFDKLTPELLKFFIS